MFYLATCEIVNEDWDIIWADKKTRTKTVEEFSTKGAAYKDRNGASLFLSKVCKEQALVGVFSERTVTKEQVYAFCRALSLNVVECFLKEISFVEISDLLDDAEDTGYTVNVSDLLESWGLHPLQTHFPWRHDYSEHMIVETSPSDLRERADSCFMKKVLGEELDRIGAGSSICEGNTGIPVHYLLRTDNKAEKNALCDILLSAFYNAKRISSRHYCRLEIVSNRNAPRSFFRAIYQCAVGGCVVICFPAADFSQESDYLTGDKDVFSKLGDAIYEFRHRVQTIVLFPAAAEKDVKMLYSVSGNVRYLELCETPVAGEEARRYLGVLASREKKSADERLFSAVQEGKTYYSEDLSKLYEEWYDARVKTDEYPQYAFLESTQKKDFSLSLGSGFQRLDAMIGLSDAKETIRKIVAHHRLRDQMVKKGLQPARSSMHMVFTGNPGTAKTTVARLFADIMKENNLLSTGYFAELGRSDLVGKYVGWTAAKVKERFEDARGGVLFIDEAYSLLDDRKGSFGDEAITTIVQEMENHRDEVIVIFAGYPDEMNAFLERNPGLHSRISFHVHFDDYSAEELCGIAKLQANRLGVKLDSAVSEKLRMGFDAARKDKYFGNGRFVRNLMEQAQMNLANRIFASSEEITQESLTRLTCEDVVFPAIACKQKAKIGF